MTTKVFARKFRGLSLPELLVSMGIFLGLSSILVVFLISNQRASEKALSHTDSSSYALLLFEKTRLEMRRARVVGNPTNDVLQYWIYEQNNGLPIFGTPHRLQFVSAGGGVPLVASLQAIEGRLTKTFGDQVGVLAQLGRDAEVLFAWQPATQTLRVTGQVGFAHETLGSLTSLRPFRFFIALNNVE